MAWPLVLLAAMVALVPFAQPGTEPNRALDEATGVLAAALAAHGDTPKVLPPMHHLAAVADAPAICARTGAGGILVPEPRIAEDVRSAHVELRLARLRCDGTLVWFATESRDAPALRDALRGAIDEAADDYAERSPDPTIPLVIPSLPPPQGTRVAVLPFAEPDVTSPLLDVATRAAIATFRAAGIDAYLEGPLAHLDAARSAPTVCAVGGASRLLVGTLRSARRARPAGVQSHVEILLTTLGCDGKVLGTADLAGDRIDDGRDERAGISAAIADAFRRYEEQLTLRSR